MTPGEQAHALKGRSEAHVTGELQRRFGATKDNDKAGLDFNARLVTELRTQKVWPSSYRA